MKPKYALTEVFTLYLVPDSFKHSVKPQPYVLTLMVMMMSGMVVRVNVNVNRMRLREEVLYGLGTGCKLSRGCMTSKNLRT